MNSSTRYLVIVIGEKKKLHQCSLEFTFSIIQSGLFNIVLGEDVLEDGKFRKITPEEYQLLAG